jgi:RNA ligase (TIGR02306 family)
MAFFGVTIETIEKVYPHPNADRLSLAKVQGLSFQFVIGKDQFVPGDKVLYFPIDSVLSQEVLEKLNMVGKLSGKDKNRIKTIKLRSEISQGLVTPVGKFLTPEQEKLSPEEITALLGVTKYEPPVQISQTGILMGLPDGYSTYDIEGADRYQEVVDLMMDMEIVVMEKMEGTNFSTVKAEEQIFVNQRNNTIVEKDDVKNSFWDIARNSGLINWLKQKSELNLGVYAEFCGPKIQDNIYGLKNHSLFIFDIKKNFKWVGFEEFKKLTQELDIPTAPVIFEGLLKDFLKGKTVQEASNGFSVVNPQVLREGIVIKPKIEQNHPKLGRLIIKQRSPQYLAGSDF